MLLYRPVGLKELELIFDSGFREFPPRLSHQPFFYPVLNFDYAAQITCDWNTADEVSGFAGYVTKFEVEENYAAQFELQVVGGNEHREFWIPGENLPQFNAHIVGQISVEAAFFGEQFKGFVPEPFGLLGKTADEQFIALARTFDYSTFDFYCEIRANYKAIYLNYLYWRQEEFSPEDLGGLSKARVLEAIAEVCAMGEQKYPLPSWVVKMKIAPQVIECEAETATFLFSLSFYP